MNNADKSLNTPWRHVLAYCAAFLLTFSVVLLVWVVPSVKENYRQQFMKELNVELALEAELFTRFVKSKKIALQDIAGYPDLKSAVMLSQFDSPTLIDYLDNTLIAGKKGQFLLEDIAGQVLYNSLERPLRNSEERLSDISELLQQKKKFFFHVISQSSNHFTFRLSVPVIYNGFAEGVLSSDVEVDLNDVFVKSEFDRKVAFRIAQKNTSIGTNIEKMAYPLELSTFLEELDVAFYFIVDQSDLKFFLNDIDRIVLVIFLISMVLSIAVLFLVVAKSQQYDFDSAFVRPAGVKVLPLLMTALGVCGSVAAALIFYTQKQEAHRQEVLFELKTVVQQINKSVQVDLKALHSVHQFYKSSSLVEEEEFKSFTHPIVSMGNQLHSMGWAPKVEFEDHSKFVTSIKRSGIRDFKIHPKKNLVIDSDEIVDEGGNYFPILFTEPAQLSVLGFDLDSNPRFKAAMQLAWQNHSAVAAQPVAGDGQDLKIFLAVVADRSQRPTIESRSLQGFLYLQYDLNVLIKEVLGDKYNKMDLIIKDVQDSNREIELIRQSPLRFSLGQGVRFQDGLTLGHRRLSIALTAPNPSVPLVDIWSAWFVFFLGSIFSISIGYIIYQQAIRRLTVEKMVQEKTRSLRVLSSSVADSNDMFVISKTKQENIHAPGVSKINYANDSFCKKTGYSRESLLGVSPLIFIGDDTDPIELSKIKNCLGGLDKYTGELIRYDKNGDPYWVDLSIFPVETDELGNTYHAWVERDITGRKSRDKEREKLLDELTGSNQELARFAYVCSHDLQEPLRMINSFALKIESHLGEQLESDEKGKKYLRFVIDGARRAQALIKDVLTYSSLDSETTKSSDVDLNEIVLNIRHTLQISMEESHAELLAPLLPVVQGHKTQLYQLFYNLVNNGIKYHESGVQPLVKIDFEEQSDRWVFSVEDSGIGMEEKHLEKIFDVFQRLHRTNEYSGTGVGLSICRKVVERHGGKIWVSSEKGVGSTFYFSLLK